MLSHSFLTALWYMRHMLWDFWRKVFCWCVLGRKPWGEEVLAYYLFSRYFCFAFFSHPSFCIVSSFSSFWNSLSQNFKEIFAFICKMSHCQTYSCLVHELIAGLLLVLLLLCMQSCHDLISGIPEYYFCPYCCSDLSHFFTDVGKKRSTASRRYHWNW